MKHFVAIFFLVTMILNVTSPLLERLQMGGLCELVELEGDDADEEGSKKESEKELEFEKKSIPFFDAFAMKYHHYHLEKFDSVLFPQHNLPVSELYTSLPELPPEA